MPLVNVYMGISGQGTTLTILPASLGTGQVKPSSPRRDLSQKLLGVLFPKPPLICNSVFKTKGKPHLFPGADKKLVIDIKSINKYSA